MKRIGSRLTLAATLCLATLASAAEDPTELRKLFPLEAELTSDASGLCRLELPAEILSHCQADLSDLRLFDVHGRETAYVVDSLRLDQNDLEVIHRSSTRVLAVDRREERREDGPPRFHENYTLAVPDLPVPDASWELVLSPRKAELVARIDLEVDRGHGRFESWIENGSAFRIASPAAERLRFLISPDAKRLRISLVSERHGYLRPAFAFEARHTLAGQSPGVVNMTTTEIHNPADKTVVVLDRPRGLIPARLRLRTSTGAFRRQVTVWDDGPSAVDSPLAEAAVFRIDAIAVVEDVEIDLAPARGDRLRVEISDRDSRPLEEVSFDAVIVQPVLFFSMPEGQRSATLRFGGARAHRPDYDLAALRPGSALPVNGEAAHTALRFWDPSEAHKTDLSDLRANPHYDPKPALAFAMRPGAELETRVFAHRRDLTVEPSAEGLTVVSITAADLAVARADLADLRIVDGDRRQWAYLIEQRATSSDLVLTIDHQKRTDSGTSYTFALPHSPLVADRVFLDFAEPFFDRPFELLGTLTSGERKSLTGSRLVRHRGDPRPVTLAIGVSRLTGLALEVTDGDDAPLSVVRATVRVPRPELFVAAPAGRYHLLLGHPDAEAPRYELERVRSTVLSVPASPALSSELQANPDFTASARFMSSAGAQQLVLWMVLGIAVLALSWLALRLARQEKNE